MKKRVALLVLLFSITGSMKAGMHFGMADAVKAEVKELDKKVVSGKFRFVNGATGVTGGGANSVRRGVRSAGPSDGNWVLSANKVRARVASIEFEKEGLGLVRAHLQSACTVTYDRSLGSHSVLLDCPFTIAEGNYIGVQIGLADTYDILIQDTTNGIFTDPTSSTLLTSTPPAEGAQFVSYSNGLGINHGTSYFESTLTIGEGRAEPVIRLLLDATHTMTMSSSNGTLTLGSIYPLTVVPFIGTVPQVAVYCATAAASLNYAVPAGNVPHGDVSLFYQSDGQPSIFNMNLAPSICGPGLGIGSSSHNPSPLTGLNSYLGKDGNGVIGGAIRGSNNTFTTMFSFSELTTVGTNTTLNIKCTSSPTAPTSGDDYSSGVPSFSPDGQYQLILLNN